MIKKPPKVRIIDTKGSKIKNDFQKPLIVLLQEKIKPIDTKINENIVICSCVWETKSFKVLAGLKFHSSSLPRYCSVIPEDENSEFRYTYTIPKLKPTPSVIK